MLSIVAFVVVARAGAPAGPDPARRSRTRTSSPSGRPAVLPPNPPADWRRPGAAGHGRCRRPLRRPAVLRAARRRPPPPRGARRGRSAAGRRLADARGRPARVGLRRAHAGRLEVLVDETGRARARSRRGARRARPPDRRAALGDGARPPRHHPAGDPARGLRPGAGHRPRGGALRARPGGRAAAHRRQRRSVGAPPPEPVWSWPSWGCSAGETAADVAEVAARRRLAPAPEPVAPGVVGPDGLARAERDHDRVAPRRRLRRPTAAGSAWRDFCLRQADAVVLVARAGVAVPEHGPSPARPARPRAARRDPDPDERVGLGGRPPTPGSSPWSTATSATGLRPLADRLAGRSLGLVLAGGGARAFAHVGVLRELEDAGLHVDRVAGTQHRRDHRGRCTPAASTARSSRRSATRECVRRKPFSDWRLPGRSLARGPPGPGGDGARLRRATPVLEGLPRQLAVVSVDLCRRTRQVHRRGNLVDAALASVRLPVLFAPIPRRRRPPARRRRRARQPARRPAHRARRGAGRRRQHRVGRRRPGVRTGPAAGARRSARPCCAP